MTTHLDRIVNELGALRAEAIRRSAHDHEPAALSSLLKDAGGTLETFLKARVFPNGNLGLAQLITRLATAGVNANDVAALHALRLAYNAAKHDPNYTPDVDVVVKMLGDARDVLGRLRGQSVGTTEQTVTPSYRRRVWIAGWDHFVHGDGEIHVFAPIDETECDFPRGIDTIYLKGLAYPDVLRTLGTAVRPGLGVIPEKFLKFWQGEGDFAGAYVFDGEYRDLLRTLVGAELRFDLEQSLKRESDRDAMRTALAFATVDVVRDPLAPPDKDGLRTEVQLRAMTDYAAPSTAPLSTVFATEFVDLVLEVAGPQRAQISGPRFVPAGVFEQLRTNAIARRGRSLISASHELVLLLGNL